MKYLNKKLNLCNCKYVLYSESYKSRDNLFEINIENPSPGFYND